MQHSEDSVDKALEMIRALQTFTGYKINVLSQLNFYASL